MIEQNNPKKNILPFLVLVLILTIAAHAVARQSEGNNLVSMLIMTGEFELHWL